MLSLVFLFCKNFLHLTNLHYSLFLNLGKLVPASFIAVLGTLVVGGQSAVYYRIFGGNDKSWLI